MHVLALAASPRRGGNSETLLDSAIQGAVSAGASVDKVVVNNLDIRPCQNCGGCDKAGECVQSDDMTQVYEKLAEADAFIIGSPIYFGNVPAQLKALIDRCQSLWIRKYVLKTAPGLKPPRNTLFLCVGGFKKHQKLFDQTRQVVKIWLLVLNAILWRSLVYLGIDEKGAIQAHPTALKEAFDAGKELVAQ